MQQFSKRYFIMATVALIVLLCTPAIIKRDSMNSRDHITVSKAFVFPCSPEENKEISSDGKCPFGHESLRFVPVLYGPLIMTTELEKEIDETKVLIGGCLSGGPQNKLVCSSCFYVSNSDREYWEKCTTNPENFFLKLHNIIQDWPSSINIIKHYSQRVTPQGVKISDNVYYWSNIQQSDMDFLVTEYLNLNKLKWVKQEQGIPPYNFIFYKAKLEGQFVLMVRLEHDPTLTETYLSVELLQIGLKD